MPLDYATCCKWVGYVPGFFSCAPCLHPIAYWVQVCRVACRCYRCRFGRRLVIITYGPVICTLALLTLAPFHGRRSEIARTPPKTSQRLPENGPKGAKKGRRGPREGPKRDPRRARGGPGGPLDGPSDSTSALGGSPVRLAVKTGPVLGCFGVRFGAQVGPQIVQNWPRSASKKGVQICTRKNTGGEPESQA